MPRIFDMKTVEEAVYLGGLLTTTSSAKPEVTRRLGEARGGFKALAQCWAHANITRHRKVQVYLACIVSKLLYNLDSLWLLQADLARIDAFHVKCLRRIYSIPSSYISRISNRDVMKTASQSTLSSTLAERQAKLYGDIAALPETHVLRRLTCEPGSSEPRQWTIKRRQGRPKQQWAACVHKYRQHSMGIDSGAWVG